MYRKSNRAKRVDRTCRNHGGCPVCRGSRTYQGRREAAACDAQMREFMRVPEEIRCDIWWRTPAAADPLSDFWH